MYWEAFIELHLVTWGPSVFLWPHGFWDSCFWRGCNSQSHRMQWCCGLPAVWVSLVSFGQGSLLAQPKRSICWQWMTSLLTHIPPHHLFHSIYVTARLTRFGIGVRIFLGRVDGPICPVKSLLSYLAVRGSAQNGSPLSRKKLVEAVRHALEVQGLDVHQFQGHSFWIGAATTAAACGLEDSLIQTLGRWRSSAFTRYIRTPQSTLVAVSPALLSSSL